MIRNETPICRVCWHIVRCFTPASTLIGAAFVALIGSCAARESVDDRIQRLVSEGSRSVGPDAASPEDRPRVTGDPRPTPASRGATATINPPAEQLEYIPADEARDVSQRLERMMLTPIEPREVTLSDAFRQSQRTGREFLNAEEDYLLTAIALLSERHLWGPRLFNDTSAVIAGGSTDGDFDHALRVVNSLRATQRLPYGGEVEARWVFDATEQLREQATGRYTQSSALVLAGNIPLLRGAGEVARETLVQAERNLVYRARTFERFRRTYLVAIARDFFDIVQTRDRIINQERQLDSLKRLEKSTEARVRAGRLDAFQTSIAASRVLSAEASLAGLREGYTLQLDRFKVRLGLAPDEVITAGDIDLEIPDPEAGLDQAVLAALELRLDLQNARDQIDDARRGLSNARNALLPDLNATGSVSVPTDTRERVGGLEFDPLDLQYNAGLTLSLPLDRERERLTIRAAQIALGQSERDYQQSRDDITVRVRSALRTIEVRRFQLTLAERQVEINKRRLDGQQLKADTLDPQTLVDSYNELLDAENARDAARTSLRNSILDYLLETDQLRVTREGTLRMLPGMEK